MILLPGSYSIGFSITVFAVDSSIMKSDDSEVCKEII